MYESRNTRQERRGRLFIARVIHLKLEQSLDYRHSPPRIEGDEKSAKKGILTTCLTRATARGTYNTQTEPTAPRNKKTELFPNVTITVTDFIIHSYRMAVVNGRRERLVHSSKIMWKRTDIILRQITIN